MRLGPSLAVALAATLLASPSRAGQDYWTPVGPAGQSIRALVVFQGNDPYRAAVATPAGVFFTPDYFQWILRNTGLPNASLTSLVVSPQPGPSTCPGICVFPTPLLAGINGAGVYSSIDGGGHWAEANVGLSNLSVMSLASAPSTGMAYAVTAAGLFKTADSAATWNPVVGLPPSVSAVAVSSDASRVYAGTSSTTSSNGSVFRSTDGGVTWVSASFGFPESSRVLALTADPQTTTTLYASVATAAPTNCPPPCTVPPPTAAFHVYKSVDSGSTWFEADAGMRPAGPVTSFAIDPITPLTVYASASIGTSGGVFRSRDAGSSWAGYNAGLSDTNVQTLALDPGSPATVYAGTAASGVFVNTFSPSGGCGPETLCLVQGRFQVRVSWDYGGQTLPGGAVPTTASAGSFWFLTSDNLELTIKILDARGVNGSWWVFVGALSNVEYTITVTDTVSLVTRTYFNPQGRLASIADTSAF